MHREYTQLMSLVLDGAASPEEAGRLREHLVSCPSCTETWERWRAVDWQLSAAPMMPVPRDLVRKVTARLEERRRRTAPVGWIGSGVLLAWGLAICTLWLLAAAVIWWAVRDPLQASQLLTSGAERLSEMSLFLRGIQTLLRRPDLPGAAVTVGMGFYFSLCAGLAILGAWFFTVGRRVANVRTRVE